ncbi:endonuclease/exonuclease/phosphatase family protein [Utexia brackfieldae]|uniref:endonuclease/exonuclease/phosphatase family protein n=1 Tax=Utexia brackfieldae TaxID=3074108 RepID=UPI00370D33D6
MVKSNHILRYCADSSDVEIILPNHHIFVDQPLTADNTINILVWNIFKQKRADWISVLKKYAKHCQLVLLQEAQTTPTLINYVTRHYRVADQVPAFSVNDSFTGVMTLAKTLPIYTRAYKAREPIIRVPKSALITLYPLANTMQTLMVANIHAVNFSFGLKVFQQQLDDLLLHIRDHQGPVILAGDFNTWSRQRLSLLHYLTTEIQLLPVNFDTDLRKTFMGRPLDFVFYRGLSLTDSRIISTIASDHNPLLVSFQY